jgi:hypothetical protein
MAENGKGYMKVLSVDPSWDKPMAWALFNDGHLRTYGKADKEALHKLQVRDIDIVVTENPFPGGHIKKHSYKGRAESFKALCFAVGAIYGFAFSREAEIQLIRPVDWKTFYSLTKKTNGDMQKTIRVKLTEVEADEDIHDAILIGMYFIEHVMLRMERDQTLFRNKKR